MISIENRNSSSNRCFLIIVFFILIVFCKTSAYAKGFSIFPNKGSFELQLDAIIQEINKLPGTAPITIRLASGYYQISKTVVLTGVNHRIILEGANNKKTILSGSIRIDGWEITDDGLWKCRLPDEIPEGYIPDQLYVNGVRATRSRTPNHGFYELENGVKQDQLYVAKLNHKDMKTIGIIEDDEIPIVSVFRKWAVSKHYIKNVSRGDNSLLFAGADFPTNNQLQRGNGVVLENIKACINKPGDWCSDKNGIIYYYPRQGENFFYTEIRVPVVEKLLCCKLKKGSEAGISIKNIIFEHTTYQIPHDGSTFDQAASGMSAAIEIDNMRNFTFENCEVRNTANYGIWLRYNCRHSSITNCYFHDLGAGAIKISSSSRTPDYWCELINVENNIIHQYGQLMESAVGIILFNASDCIIKHNDLHYGNYTGVSLGWTWGYDDSPSKRNVVAYNRISHIGDGRLNDLGGIYTLGRSEGTHIHHNVISNVKSGDFRGWGIYADQGTTGIVVEKNVVFNTIGGGFHQHFGNENIVRNNIFAWGDQSQFTLSRVMDEYEERSLIFEKNIILMKKGLLMSGAGLSNEKFIARTNCYWSFANDIPKVGGHTVTNWIRVRDSSSIFQDPQFRDPQNGDFKLKNKSICKKIGFVEFDYKNAGVYGKKKWKALAKEIRYY